MPNKLKFILGRSIISSLRATWHIPNYYISIMSNIRCLKTSVVITSTNLCIDYSCVCFERLISYEQSGDYTLKVSPSSLIGLVWYLKCSVVIGK